MCVKIYKTGVRKAVVMSDVHLLFTYNKKTSPGRVTF